MFGAGGVQRFIGVMQERRGAPARVARLLRRVGPYLFIELLLPGGTLLSLLLFLYRRGAPVHASPPASTGVQPLLVLARIAAGVRSLW